jgi:hypothetical protein
MDIAEEAVKLLSSEDNVKWSIRYAAGITDTELPCSCLYGVRIE